MPVTLARGPCQPRWWRSRTVFEESHLARNLTGAEVCHRHREGSFDPGISVKRKLNPSWPAGPAKNLAKTKTSSPFSTATGFLRSSSRARSFRVRYSRRFLAVCSRETNLGRRIFPPMDCALRFDSRPSIERQWRVRITGKTGETGHQDWGTPRLAGHPCRMPSSARRRQPWTARRFAVLEQF